MSGSHPSWADIEECVKSRECKDGVGLASGVGTDQNLTAPHHASKSRAPAWHHHDIDITDFGPSGLDDDIDVVACQDCGKPVLRDALSFHHENCKLIQDITDGRLSPSIIEGEMAASHKRTASEVSDISAISQRPVKLSKKAEKRLEVEARKRARLEAQEAKKKKNKSMLSARKKGPTDVDTQCGVINDKGLPCSRSLTCKSHSMGAKRSVPGRSRPYDELLLEWQKVHNPALVAKLEERERAVAASRAAAAERKSRKALEKRKKLRIRDQSAAMAAGGAAGSGGVGGVGGSARKDGLGHNAASQAQMKIQEDPHSDMFALGFSEDDVDVEIRDLIAAIQSAGRSERTKILPLAQQSFAGIYTRRSHTFRGCRELLREGLRNGNKHTSAFSAPFDASNAPSLIAAQQIISGS